jgi:cytochrome c-type biogenesis protein CcmH
VVRATARRRAGLLRAAAAAALLFAAAAAPAWASTLDDRVYAVASQLMCPVCAGQTVAESDSAVARQMRDVIRAKLQAGETPAAILDFFVGQFGESVLAEPPRRGLSLLLYLGPAAGVAGGLAIAVLCIRRWTGRSGRPPSADPGPAARAAPPSAGAAEERARLAGELEARERF